MDEKYSQVLKIAQDENPNCSSASELETLAEELLDYTIPKEIKDRIPEYFYYALGGECVSIFGKDALISDEVDIRAMDFFVSTAGWSEALKMACKKLDMNWLFDYWETLDWIKGDIFDGEILEEIIKVFNKNDGANSYYKYLLSMEK